MRLTPLAPVVLAVPDSVDVRKVDLAVDMQVLSFHAARREAGGAAPLSARASRPSARSSPGRAAGRRSGTVIAP